jgi:peptide/nickel transport system permease protein
VSVTNLEAEVPGVGIGELTGRRRSAGLVRRSLRLWRTRIGLLMAGGLIAIAIFGPLLAPHSSSAFVGPPFSSASSHPPFGTDYLGQDVWSRFLDGGGSILLSAGLATLLGVGSGLLIGLYAALRGGWVDDALLRITDILLAFPQIFLPLIAMATVGPKEWLIIVTVALTTMPRTVRVMRGAAASVVEREFIAAARSIGDSRLRILFVELLPNVIGTLVVETTFRLTYAIQLIAALAFLGLSTSADQANWGTMVSQNATALTLQPWAALLPAIAIAVLTVGTGLVGDGLARTAARIDRGG